MDGREEQIGSDSSVRLVQLVVHDTVTQFRYDSKLMSVVRNGAVSGP